MPSSLTTSHTAAELQQLVARITAEVVRRVSASTQAQVAAAPPRDATGARAEPSASTVPREPPVPSAPTGHLLAEKVITLAIVSKLPADLTLVTVRHNAVLTPSAREWLADHRVGVQRAAIAAGGAAIVAASPAFLVGGCDLPGRTVGQAAAVVRAVPNAQQLPSTGLSSLVTAFADAASRSGSRGLLLSSRPAAAALIANRTRAVRAVAATDVREALTLAEECRATLLVVNPARFSPGSLQRLAVEFAKQEQPDLPHDLAEASRPCSCSRTSPEASR
jgi:hypothetical protein